MAARLPATNENTAEALRDIKPPVHIPDPWFWVWCGLGLLAFIASVMVLWRLWKRRQSRIDAIPAIPAHERARRKLEAALELIDQPRPFCIEVSDAIRFYLEERFQLNAPDRTTEEFLAELQSSPVLTADQKLGLADFLERCDLAKFARFEPGESELQDLHESALRLVEETEPRPPSGDAMPTVLTH